MKKIGIVYDNFMKLQQSQLYTCNNQFAFAANIILKINNNTDTNQKSLRIKKNRSKPKKLHCKSCSALNGARLVSPHVAFTFGDHTILKGSERVASF